MTIPDPLVTLIVLLKADPAIAAQVGTRVFGEELPPTEVSNMPRKAIVLNSNGGRYELDNLKLGLMRFNSRCYGLTVYESREVDLALYEFLKNVRRSGVSGLGTVFHSNSESGPFSLRDPDTTWPYMLSMYRCLVGETVNA